MATAAKKKAAPAKKSTSGSGKPNILVIWGDDIGIANLSCYTHGLMGYQTPNIDRIASEGMLFTDSYGEQSCTAGRSSSSPGQSVHRTGLSKVGIPGAPQGMLDSIVTIASLLKDQGYTTGSSARIISATSTSTCRRCHGFDEFFGNLYHLNAEEEPEMAGYPKDPAYREQFGPRGVLHCYAATRTTRPCIRAGVAWASRRSKTPGR
jgi:arylsulfatase